MRFRILANVNGAPVRKHYAARNMEQAMRAFDCWLVAIGGRLTGDVIVKTLAH